MRRLWISADIARPYDAERAERCFGDDIADARLALRDQAVPGDLNEIRLAEDVQHILIFPLSVPRGSVASRSRYTLARYRNLNRSRR